MNESLLTFSDKTYRTSPIAAKIEEIAGVIPNVTHHLENFSLHDGWLGVSLFYFFYARYTGNEAYLDEAARHLNNALELMSSPQVYREYRQDSYYCCLASLGPFFQQVNRKGFLEIDEDKFLSGIDQDLANLAKKRIKEEDFGRFSGALASGHYFYYRSKNNPLREGVLTEIVYGLKHSAIKEEDGSIYWLPKDDGDQVYRGCFHAVATIISFLTALLEEGIAVDTCRKLIQQSSIFVLKHKQEHAESLFPVVTSIVTDKAQFSPYYVDLGIGYALFRAAEALKDAALKVQAEAILAYCLKCSHEDGFVSDAGINSGAAGIAQIFGRLARLSNNRKAFLESEAYWMSQLPKYSTAENEFSGFESSEPGATPGLNVSFGWGIIGIGISLMRYEQPDLPDLDGLNIYI